MFRAVTVSAVLAALLAASTLSTRPAAAQSVTVTLVSDTATQVVELGRPAAAVFALPNWPTLEGASTVWVESNATTDQHGPFTFRTLLPIPANATQMAGSISVTADNAYELFVNGTRVGGDGEPTRTPSACGTLREWETIETFSLDAHLLAGATNTFDVRAFNYEQTVQTPGCDVAPTFFGANPAMVLFRVDVTFDTSAQIDVLAIKPVHLEGQGYVRAAILSTPAFAAGTVDPSTVCLRPATRPTEGDCTAAKSQLKDVDGDGDLDLLLRFEEDEVGLTLTDTQVLLTGSTFDGRAVEGLADMRVLLDLPEVDGHDMETSHHD